MEAFSDMKAPAFVFDVSQVREHLRQLSSADLSTVAADRKTRQFYSHTDHLLWIDRFGIDSRTDSLLAWLHTVSELGFAESAFCVAEAERDREKLRNLEFSDDDDINQLAARLEYHLTKACLRYTYGQRYGFTNPSRIFNNLDIEKQDSTRRILRYRGLFDVAMETAAPSYDSLVLSKVENGSIAEYLRQIQPSDKYYLQLKAMLIRATTDDERNRIISNMERGRWRLQQSVPESGKRIVVNIPAFHLYAYDDANAVLDMRIACGAVATKTPLLTSAVEWMEVNPQWVIPKSIIEKDVVRHVGDTAYFARNHYDIYDKSTNKTVDVQSVSREMMLSGKYRIAQQSGSHNSLGRIVFRFKNAFSVYLHYTSSPGVFQRETRAVSHGCVRVAKPFELANFVLDNPDEWLLDRIRISMDIAPETDRGRSYLRAHSNEKEHKLIGYVPVKPHVPLYIIYNTLWPDETGELRTWPDVYGYDRVILEYLKTYM
mgnify:CR=1 FL=1